jgi:hypothetical protein
MISSKIKWSIREYEVSDMSIDEPLMQVAETEVTSSHKPELYDYLDKLLENYLINMRRLFGNIYDYSIHANFKLGYAYAKVFDSDGQLIYKMELVKVDQVDLEDLHMNESINKIVKEHANDKHQLVATQEKDIKRKSY